MTLDRHQIVARRFATLDPRAYAWDAVIFWLGLFGGFLTLAQLQ